MTTKTDELKPCPFCGEAAYFERHGTHRQSCIVACGSCGCRHESGYEYELSAHGWNTRQPAMPADADDDIEAAAKTLAECMDYPWGHMPTQGRIEMRKYAQRVLDAARRRIEKE